MHQGKKLTSNYGDKMCIDKLAQCFEHLSDYLKFIQNYLYFSSS
jgi:hypothetical protein